MVAAVIFAAALAASALGEPTSALARPAQCQTPPPAIQALKLTRFYSDKSGTVIDRDLKAAHRKQVRPLVQFLRFVVKQADRSIVVASGASPQSFRKAARAGRCAARWINAWAKGGALLGVMASKQAAYERNWDMTGTALAYLKVRKYVSKEQRQTIEAWLIKLADRARGFFDDRRRRRNNHWYWLGLGLGATALATGSQRHWEMARGIMGDAARDIQGDGSLSYEMARQGRALHYHAFAAMALVTLSELAFAHGENWYQMGDGALHRLVGLTVQGLQRPGLFETLSGFKQKHPVKPGAGWLQLYTKRFPDRLTGQRPTMKPGHRWLGGNTGKLRQALYQDHSAKAHR